jgi:hypothetical protein
MWVSRAGDLRSLCHLIEDFGEPSGLLAVEFRLRDIECY